MAGSQRKAVANYRKRLKRQGMTRLDVRVRKTDAPLLREVVEALSDPDRERETRALLRERFVASPPQALKRLLADAPLEGIELTREQDHGRDVDL